MLKQKGFLASNLNLSRLWNPKRRRPLWLSVQRRQTVRRRNQLLSLLWIFRQPIRAPGEAFFVAVGLTGMPKVQWSCFPDKGALIPLEQLRHPGLNTGTGSPCLSGLFSLVTARR